MFTTNKSDDKNMSNVNRSHKRVSSNFSYQRKLSMNGRSSNNTSRHIVNNDAGKRNTQNKHVKESQQVELSSPTSVSMKNSFIIQNTDHTFDQYYKQIARRKNLSQLSMHENQMYGKIKGKRPAARDGHTGIVNGDLFIVFGGDRHHMPFNDTFILDLKSENQGRGQIFY